MLRGLSVLSDKHRLINCVDLSTDRHSFQLLIEGTAGGKGVEP